MEPPLAEGLQRRVGLLLVVGLQRMVGLLRSEGLLRAVELLLGARQAVVPGPVEHRRGKPVLGQEEASRRLPGYIRIPRDQQRLVGACGRVRTAPSPPLDHLHVTASQGTLHGYSGEQLNMALLSAVAKTSILQMTSLRKINVAAEPKRSSHIL